MSYWASCGGPGFRHPGTEFPKGYRKIKLGVALGKPLPLSRPQFSSQYNGNHYPESVSLKACCEDSADTC